MTEGWILLHRKLQDCTIWSDSSPFDMRSAWVDLLLLANHRDVEMLFDYKPMTISRGQYLTSVRKLGERWGWSKNRVLKYLRLLENLKMIERKSNNQRTLITIVNYGVYQDVRDTGMDTPIDTGMDTGMPQTNNENNENNNNINNRAFQKPSLEQVREYCLERKNNVDPEAFVSFYESKGWMVGKNKMKDWKAAVRTWERSRSSGTGKSKPDKPQFGSFSQREYDFDELRKIVSD